MLNYYISFANYRKTLKIIDFNGRFIRDFPKVIKLLSVKFSLLKKY